MGGFLSLIPNEKLLYGKQMHCWVDQCSKLGGVRHTNCLTKCLTDQMHVFCWCQWQTSPDGNGIQAFSLVTQKSWSSTHLMCISFVFLRNRLNLFLSWKFKYSHLIYSAFNVVWGGSLSENTKRSPYFATIIVSLYQQCHSYRSFLKCFLCLIYDKNRSNCFCTS